MLALSLAAALAADVEPPDGFSVALGAGLGGSVSSLLDGYSVQLGSTTYATHLVGSARFRVSPLWTFEPILEGFSSTSEEAWEGPGLAPGDHVFVYAGKRFGLMSRITLAQSGASELVALAGGGWQSYDLSYTYTPEEGDPSSHTLSYESLLWDLGCSIQRWMPQGILLSADLYLATFADSQRIDREKTGEDQQVVAVDGAVWSVDPSVRLMAHLVFPPHGDRDTEPPSE